MVSHLTDHIPLTLETPVPSPESAPQSLTLETSVPSWESAPQSLTLVEPQSHHHLTSDLARTGGPSLKRRLCLDGIRGAIGMINLVMFSLSEYYLAYWV